MMTNPPCPLCSNESPLHFHKDASRDYLICSVCDLTFAHPRSWLSRDEEFKRYEFHQNDVMDSGYRKFLQKLCTPMLERITPASQGLDFGSGPGPLLKLMLEEHGHKVSLFDTFYAPDITVFNSSYDFITASEVVEHLHHPLIALDRLWSCLHPGGYLGLMTSMRVAGMSFLSWHYILDETHVIFFSPQTMIWLASHWGAALEIISDSVVIFQKKSITPSWDSNPSLE